MTERVKGLAEAHSMFGAVPAAARDQLGVELAIIARDILAAQKRDAPNETGKLEAGLQLHLQLEELRVRVGLLNLLRGRSKLFYGRIIEFGRRAQTVLVTRHLKRRVRGNGRTSKRTIQYLGESKRLRRRGPNAGTPIGSAYKMRVRAMPERPFVRKERPEIDVAQRLANFWGSTIKSAGGAA
ncbi:hypothetical protein CA235_09665 [Sphingomonas sp. ABOLF]|uniref:hypothetical protein n=1 Tax=Sphingomonas sp. ABOLF TaxID=1985879 RepID=UPI000F7F4123|nr:hypothetical protein [Sphingomonas sp. ABOLF]RSV15193.1 hypothetical protein CA235_09665 [Sphingomonas sp. ABOLF]